MGNIHRFRRLRWGPPRKPSTPEFLRRRRSPPDGLFRTMAFVIAAAFVAAGAYVAMAPERANGVRDFVDAAIMPWLGSYDTRMIDGASVRVVDGDSLRSAGGDIRLLGIDAPELDQTCRDAGGREWACGRAARDRLRALVSRRKLSCVSRERDRYGRALSICSTADGADIGETLVREGHAVAYRAVTRRYDTAEAEARAAQRGIWRGTFQRPDQWRTEHSRAEH